MPSIFKNNQEVAAAFAKYLAAQIAPAKVFHIALSGGSTPKVLFQILAEQYATKIDWSKVHLFWGDERCVPPDHSESNYGMTKEKLLDHISIPFVNIHRVLGRRDPAEEAIRYGKEIQWSLPEKNGLPVFDMVLLGMGSDGHTASIFPHQMELLSAPTICGVATHPDSGQKRITLTGKVINQAQQIHFLVTGASKKEKVQAIFNKTGNYEAYPAAHIQEAKWWMDEAAWSTESTT